MKRNPLLPFALIAVLGLGVMFFMSFQGVHEEKKIADAKSGKVNVANAKPEEIVKTTCISCHGDNLQGGVGPNISKIGSQLSEDEIKTILLKGKNGKMPAGLVPPAQVDKVSKWLAEKK